MARAEIPDTSVFIGYFRSGTSEKALLQGIDSGRLWLSSVVASELYAGARTQDEARALDRLVQVMRKNDRIIVPNERDWIQAGRFLSRHSRLSGQIRPRDHLADVLILVSAARLKGAVQTANLRHFSVWAELARDAGLDVVVESISE